MSNNNVQTTYLLTPLAAPIEGTQVSQALEYVGAYAAETIIPYGRAVVRGTEDRGAKLISDNTHIFLGVSLANFTAINPYNPPAAQEQTQYNITDVASILLNGTVWLWNEGAVTPGAPVYYRYAAAGPYTVIGRFGTTSDAGNILLPGAIWTTTNSAATGTNFAQMQFSVQ